MKTPFVIVTNGVSPTDGGKFGEPASGAKYAPGGF